MIQLLVSDAMELPDIKHIWYKYVLFVPRITFYLMLFCQVSFLSLGIAHTSFATLYIVYIIIGAWNLDKYAGFS
jgi:hypothetical protein